MLAQNGFDFILENSGTWAAPVIGILATGLVFLAGWMVLGRRKAPLTPPAAPAPEQPPGKVGLATDPFVQGSVVERRSALRRRGNAIAILISDAEISTHPYPGWVVDRSVGGLCLSVSQAIESGTILSVRTTSAPESCPWVQLEVRSCRQVDKDWELGCQFVRTPPWSVLLLFG